MLLTFIMKLICNLILDKEEVNIKNIAWVLMEPLLSPVIVTTSEHTFAQGHM